MDHATVKRKYQLVKFHDRVGRLADTLEYSLVALPIERFDPALLAELKSEAASNIEVEGERIVIKHMYIERRMQPLNLYLQEAAQDGDETRMRQALRDYGRAIKELAGAGIFPGDMLVKNFGMTRHDRVVFYDYDEIEYMTECNFRRIPPPRTPEDEMSAEPYWSVGPNDVYPEQFASFLVTGHQARQAFLEHHADLMESEFWAGKQARIRAGLQEDVYPYPQEIRFVRTSTPR
jgi:isocitrate dehydrogenase kinase/phosphatase